jgi:uncharacterized integral membrane protein
VSRFSGIAAAGVVLVFVLLFSRGNGAEQVVLNLGVRTFYRVPLSWVALGSFLLGMLVMLLAGLQADLRVRRFLRDRLAAEAASEEGSGEVDHLQQDLFASPLLLADEAELPSEEEPMSTPPPGEPPEERPSD